MKRSNSADIDERIEPLKEEQKEQVNETILGNNSTSSDDETTSDYATRNLYSTNITNSAIQRESNTQPRLEESQYIDPLQAALICQRKNDKNEQLSLQKHQQQYEQQSQADENSLFFTTTDSRAQNPFESNMLPLPPSRASLWQKPKNESMFSIENWSDLQDKLKQEVNLVYSESSSKAKLQEELENCHLQYYRTYIELLELGESSREIKAGEEVKKKVLIENSYKLFKDTDPFAKSMLMTLAQNPKLLAQIIKTQGAVLDEPMKNLIRTIVNTFYDNIIEEEVWDQDIIVFIANVIKFEVDSASTPSDIKFKSNQVLTKILNEFTKRQDFQRYTKYIFKMPLQFITKARKIIICPKKIFEQLRKKQAMSTSTTQSSSALGSSMRSSAASASVSRKTFGGTTPKDSFAGQSSYQDSMSGKNSGSKYEQILRQYDSGLNSKANIVSNDVMKIVGLSEESKSARFQPRKTFFTKQGGALGGITAPTASAAAPLDAPKKSDDTVAFQTQPFSEKSDRAQSQRSQPLDGVVKRGADSAIEKEQQLMQENISRILKKNIDGLKNLTNAVFDSIFKNIYNIPVPIRITCKIIEILTRQKFKDISDSMMYTIIGYFLFDCYLIPQFMFPHRLRQVNLIKDEHEDNLFEVKKLMKNIYKRELFPPQDEVNFKYLNPLIKDLSSSIEEYFQELLLINEEAVKKIVDHDEQVQEKMKVYCLCITLENIQTLCSIIESNYDQIHSLNAPVADNARRIMRMSPDCKIFEERKDLDIPGLHKPSHVYALLIEVNMPKALQTNYEKEYRMQYAVTKGMTPQQMIMVKAKNMTLQVLVSIEKLSNILSFTGYKNMELTELFKIFEDGYYLDSKAKFEGGSGGGESVPIMIKAKYLMCVINQLGSEFTVDNMKRLHEEMVLEFEERFRLFMKTSNHTKSELLKARTTLNKNRAVLKDSIEQLQKDKKRRVLYNFIEAQQLNLCLTSKRSRLGLKGKFNNKPYSSNNNSNSINSGSNSSTNQLNTQSIRSSNSQDGAEEEDSVITICSQDCCIHSHSNLEFVIGLTQGTTDSQSSSQFSSSTPSNNGNKKKEIENPSHCRNIVTLIDALCALPEIAEAVTNGGELTAINNIFSQLLDELFDLLKTSPLFSSYSHSDTEWIYEQLQMYITRKVYDQVFPKEMTYSDAAMFCRMKVLSWISYDHLEIDQTNRVDEMWDIAARALLSMDYVKSPQEKLESLIESTTIMTNVLKLTSASDGAASADSILPLSIYILLKAAPTRLCSNINFITAFCNKEKMLTQVGYCFAQIKLAVDFLTNLSPKQVGVSEQFFHQSIYEKEVEYGIYFLKKRPRAIRAPINRELVLKVVQEIQKRNASKEKNNKETEAQQPILAPLAISKLISDPKTSGK